MIQLWMSNINSEVQIVHLYAVILQVIATAHRIHGIEDSQTCANSSMLCYICFSIVRSLPRGVSLRKTRCLWECVCVCLHPCVIWIMHVCVCQVQRLYGWYRRKGAQHMFAKCVPQLCSNRPATGPILPLNDVKHPLCSPIFTNKLWVCVGSIGSLHVCDCKTVWHTQLTV